MLNTDSVTDISPLRALPQLTRLTCNGNWDRKGKLSDLSPLRGMRLTSFHCSHANVSDLSSLQGMPLTELMIGDTQVADLSPLKGMKLEILECDNSPVSDLSPLQGMPLAALQCDNTPVSDLSPMLGMSLKEISLTPRNIVQGMDALRQMRSLEKIGLTWDRKVYSPAEFWKKYDAGEFGKPLTTLNNPIFKK